VINNVSAGTWREILGTNLGEFTFLPRETEIPRRRINMIIETTISIQSRPLPNTKVRRYG
jgi:hypothetical protein